MKKNISNIILSVIILLLVIILSTLYFVTRKNNSIKNTTDSNQKIVTVNNFYLDLSVDTSQFNTKEEQYSNGTYAQSVKNPDKSYALYYNVQPTINLEDEKKPFTGLQRGVPEPFILKDLISIGTIQKTEIYRVDFDKFYNHIEQKDFSNLLMDINNNYILVYYQKLQDGTFTSIFSSNSNAVVEISFTLKSTLSKDEMKKLFEESDKIVLGSRF